MSINTVNKQLLKYWLQGVLEEHRELTEKDFINLFFEELEKSGLQIKQIEQKFQLEVEHQNEPSKKMNEFLDKVGKLCHEYKYEFHPTVEGWTGKTYDTFACIGNGEKIELIYLDRDGLRQMK